MTEIEPRRIERYGWRPSLPDQRDLIADTSGLPILDEVDLRDEQPRCYDQGQLGSCTANTVAAAGQILLGLPWVPSRLDIYWAERYKEGGDAQVQQDSGAYGRDGYQFAVKTGVFDERLRPYDVARFRDPSPTDVKRLKLPAYKAVRRVIKDFKRALSNRQTVGLGFSVYESFEAPNVAKYGVMPMPKQGERLLGGHEVLVVGYLKEHPHHALVRNSWGGRWGMGGHFLMPWSVILDPSLSSDFRTFYRPAL
jgi:hypothetical protein